jgi:hypothetical protein
MGMWVLRISVAIAALLGAWCAWHYWHPPVGLYVAILGVAAAIMTLRPSQSASEKAFWILVIFACGVLEITNLYYDRAQHDQAEHVARQNEALAFKAIADGINTSIQNDQVQFAETIGKLNSTLHASENAALNTAPFANIRVTLVAPVTADPNQPILIEVGKKMQWNIYFLNIGTSVAKDVKYAAMAFFAKPDDKEAQAAIAKMFNDEWPKRKLERPKLDLKTNDQLFFTFSSEAVTADQISSLNVGSNTIYIYSRFVWSDPTGRWASDRCEGYQDIKHDFAVTHRCPVYSKDRYAFKQ